jgi:hypothetical protein
MPNVIEFFRSSNFDQVFSFGISDGTERSSNQMNHVKRDTGLVNHHLNLPSFEAEPSQNW